MPPGTFLPIKPADVPALTVTEFTSSLEWEAAPSLAEICRRFAGDANRALVWWIRFRALQTWSALEGMADWVNTGERSPRDICEVAARFELNDQWEFDPQSFCSAVDVMVSRRSQGDPGTEQSWLQSARRCFRAKLGIRILPRTVPPPA